MKKYLSILLLFVSCYCWGQKKDSCNLCITGHESPPILVGSGLLNKKYAEVSKDGILTVYDSLQSIVSLMKLLGVEVKGFKRDDSKEIYKKYIREKNKGIIDSNNKYFKLLNKKNDE